MAVFTTISGLTTPTAHTIDGSSSVPRLWPSSTLLEPLDTLAPNDGRSDAKSSAKAPFTAIVLGSRGGGGDRKPQKEERTGTEFPPEFCHLSKSNCPVLAGVGVRRKRLMGVKNIDVYALGFYIDEEGAQKVLAPRLGSEQSADTKDKQKLFDEVIEANDLEKTIRIIITSGLVNHDKFLSGLKESLLPACEEVGETQSLQHFEQLFEGAKFRKGLELAFTSTKSGGLAARIDNRDVGEVPAPGFTRAFFGLYLGKQPVSPDGKASVSKALADIVAKSNEAAVKDEKL